MNQSLMSDFHYAVNCIGVTLQSLQWRIQNLPEGAANLLFDQFFPKTAKNEEIWTGGGTGMFWLEYGKFKLYLNFSGNLKI